MNSNAKKVSITIIIVLVGVIGGLWYLGNKKDRSKTEQSETTLASSTDLGFDLKTFTLGKKNMEEITIDKLAQAGTSSSPLSELPTKTVPYTSAKLLISNNVTTDNLKYYGQQIAKALASYNNIQNNEIATTIEALEEKNPIKAQLLLQIATNNKKIVDSLLKIYVPKTAVDVHLNLVNNLNRNATLLTDMSKILDNPNLALQSADLYRVQKLSFSKALAGVNDFFRKNNIIFSPEEGSKIYLTI